MCVCVCVCVCVCEGGAEKSNGQEDWMQKTECQDAEHKGSNYQALPSRTGIILIAVWDCLNRATIGACCTHPGSTITDKSAKGLIQKNSIKKGIRSWPLHCSPVHYTGHPTQLLCGCISAVWKPITIIIILLKRAARTTFLFRNIFLKGTPVLSIT